MVSDGASVVSYCIIHEYHQTLIVGDGIVFKLVDMFPYCLCHEFQPDPKVRSMGGLPGQSSYNHYLRSRHPECISLGIKQKREPVHKIRSQLPHMNDNSFKIIVLLVKSRRHSVQALIYCLLFFKKRNINFYSTERYLKFYIFFIRFNFPKSPLPIFVTKV